MAGAIYRLPPQPQTNPRKILPVVLAVTHDRTGSSSVVVTTSATGKPTRFSTGSSSVAVTTTGTGLHTGVRTGSLSVVVTASATGLHTGVRVGSSSVVVSTQADGDVFALLLPVSVVSNDGWDTGPTPGGNVADALDESSDYITVTV